MIYMLWMCTLNLLIKLMWEFIWHQVSQPCSFQSSWWSNDPFLTRVNELGDSLNKGIIEHDTCSNIADNHSSHEQPESQLALHASTYSDFYKSHDRGNMITRNLEQLIIPQPSVPRRTTSEGEHSTERPSSVANSHQNHFSTVGNLATKDLEVLTLPALTFYNHTININNGHH